MNLFASLPRETTVFVLLMTWVWGGAWSYMLHIKSTHNLELAEDSSRRKARESFRARALYLQGFSVLIVSSIALITCYALSAFAFKNIFLSAFRSLFVMTSALLAFVVVTRVRVWWKTPY